MEIKVKVDGVEQKAQAQLLKGTLWVHVNGHTFTQETATGRKSRGKGAAGSSDTIVAPMPGKVTKILLQPGSDVKVGQAVLVMEAMKIDRKSTRLNSSHTDISRMPSSA